MKRSLVALVSIAGLLIARVADCATTFYFTPDLALEGNIFVKWLGAGWAGLLIANTVLTLAVIACTILWWKRPLRVADDERIRDAWSFASVAYFGAPLERGPMMLKLLLGARPRRWRHVFELVGFVAPWAIMVGSAWWVLAWFAIHQFHWVAFIRVFRAAYPFSTYWPVLLLPGLIATFYGYEYREYLRQGGTQTS